MIVREWGDSIPHAMRTIERVPEDIIVLPPDFVTSLKLYNEHAITE